jgi:glycosyltransferase involved in cell wall biosynthesis
MELTVVIPAYNEINTIRQILEKVQQVDLQKEIIIIDDFSTDGTREYLEQVINIKNTSQLDENKVNFPTDNIQVLFQAKNGGKGAALKRGFSEANGNLIVIQDADLEYDPEDFLKLIQPIKEGYADVVYGSRFIGGAPHRILFFWHSIGNKILTFVSNVFTNLNLTDMETCYKMFKKDLINQIDLEENGFGIEPELTAKFAKLGARIYEVGISYYGRSYSEGKKITWRDGIRTIWAILRYNILP